MDLDRISFSLLVVAGLSLIGCTKPSPPPVQTDSVVYSAPGVRIQQSGDGLERTIKWEQDWLGDKYGPLRFACEGASVERLLTFLAEKSSRPIEEIRGKELFPAGTFQYSFDGKTWATEAELFQDVLKVTGDAFALGFEFTEEEAKTVLTVKKTQAGGA